MIAIKCVQLLNLKFSRCSGCTDTAIKWNSLILALYCNWLHIGYLAVTVTAAATVALEIVVAAVSSVTVTQGCMLNTIL